MSKWEMVSLNDVCSLITDGTHQTPQYVEKGYMFLSSKNVTTGKIDWQDIKYIPEELHKQLYTRVAPKVGDVLLAKNGTTGVAAIVDKDYVFDIYVSLALLRPKDVILSEYLLFAINNPITKRKFNKELKGIGVPNLHLKNIRETTIPLPPLETQKQIAKTLDTVAELLAIHKQQLAELNNLIKSTFFDMFGDPVTNEKGWSQCYINDVFDIIDGDRGVNYPKQDDFYDEGHCLFLNTGNVTKDGFNFDNVKFILPEKDKQLRKGKLVRGDIILTTRGTVGNIAHYNDSIPYDVVRINSGMVLLRIMNFNVSPVYFCELFKSDGMTREVKSFLSGTAQPQLPITNMKKIKIVMPPIELQTQFANIVAKIEEQKALVKKAIDETQYLFDSLMSKYFE